MLRCILSVAADCLLQGCDRRRVGFDRRADHCGSTRFPSPLVIASNYLLFPWDLTNCRSRDGINFWAGDSATVVGQGRRVREATRSGPE